MGRYTCIFSCILLTEYSSLFILLFEYLYLLPYSGVNKSSRGKNVAFLGFLPLLHTVSVLKTLDFICIWRSDLLSEVLFVDAGLALTVIFHTLRQIPFALQQQIKNELQSMVHQGIIEPAGN